MYMFVWYVRVPYIYIHPAPFVCDAIFPHCMFVHVTTVAQVCGSENKYFNRTAQSDVMKFIIHTGKFVILH